MSSIWSVITADPASSTIVFFSWVSTIALLYLGNASRLTHFLLFVLALVTGCFISSQTNQYPGHQALRYAGISWLLVGGLWFVAFIRKQHLWRKAHPKKPAPTPTEKVAKK